MKKLIMMSFLLISCNSAEVKKAIPQNAGFVEENNQCICTKEYRPVCGSNGKTYPSPCQAGCDGVKKFTEGDCK